MQRNIQTKKQKNKNKNKPKKKKKTMKEIITWVKHISQATTKMKSLKT